MDIEGLLGQLAQKGLRVRILSKREVRVMPHLPTPTRWEWWCELQHPNGHRDADHGETAFLALMSAMHRATGQKGPENRPHDNTVIVSTPAGVKMAAVSVPEKPAPRDLSFLD